MCEMALKQNIVKTNVQIAKITITSAYYFAFIASTLNQIKLKKDIHVMMVDRR